MSSLLCSYKTCFVVILITTLLICSFFAYYLSNFSFFHFHKEIIHVSTTPQAASLPLNVTETVEKFLFFVGYPRSGHSIIGSFMDAHPHMIVAHEFMLFKKFSLLSQEKYQTNLRDKSVLFNALYQSSYEESLIGSRSKFGSNAKTYTLEVDSPWTGNYDQYISVVGDKSGGLTTAVYNRSPENFISVYRQLQETVGIPIKVIHAIRNPYDLVSTDVLYVFWRKLRRGDPAQYVSSFKQNLTKLWNSGNKTSFLEARFVDETLLEKNIQLTEKNARAVTEISEIVGRENVLEVHNSELVRDPVSMINKICDFLEVECSPEYLRSCSEKVFSSVFKSRELVVWPQRLRDMVKDVIKKYPSFERYSFSSD